MNKNMPRILILVICVCIVICRNLFISRFSALERDIVFALGINEYGGVIKGKDGYLFTKPVSDEEIFLQNLSVLRDLSEKSDVSVHIALLGSKSEIMTTRTPRFYSSGRDGYLYALKQSAINSIDILSPLRYESGVGKAVFYRGDCHLTSLGAYYCYREIVSVLGETPYRAKDFSIGVVKTDFVGSETKVLQAKGTDKIALFRYKGDGKLQVTSYGETHKGLYREENLHGENPYAVFPDCSAGTIITGGENRKKLLILCDEFVNPVSPFLARHFDITAENLKYCTEIPSDGYFAVLVFCSLDALASEKLK